VGLLSHRQEIIKRSIVNNIKALDKNFPGLFLYRQMTVGWQYHPTLLSHLITHSLLVPFTIPYLLIPCYNISMKKIFLGLVAIFTMSTAVWAGDYYAVGVDYFKKGDFNKAATNLEQSVRISPSNVNARYYLAQTYLTQKRVSDASDQYSRIILLAPSSDAARLSTKGLSLINQSFKENLNAKIASSDELSRYKDNYLEYVLNAGKLSKWGAFPLRVYIEPTNEKNIALQALGEWQKRTNNLVSFVYQNSPNNAQITIDFNNKLETTSTKESYIAGHSKPFYKGGNIIKSEIEILTIDPSGKKIPNESLLFTIIHELGHTLGLNGHSPKDTDVMFARANGVKTLSQRDINTMNLLYKLDKKTFESREKPQTDVQLQQALDYAATTPDKSGGWAKLGDIYRDKKMYPDAIKNYQKAVSLEPDKADLHNLLGHTYSLAGDNQNAFASLKKACDLNKSNTLYLYEFVQICQKSNQNGVGKSYFDAYVQANPQSVFDENIVKINRLYR